MAFADSRIFISVVAVGALVGACAEQLLFIRLIPSAADLSWALWLKYALADIRFEGASAGALLVNLGWMIRNPRMRMRRSVVAAIAANAAAWIAFLIAVPPLTPSDFALIHAERTRRDAESSGRLMHHEPIIVAARPHALYYPDSSTDLPLEIFAGPAILWTANLTVPIRYGPARATRRESFIVASGGFILSTAFWAALASAVCGIVRFCRRYLRERSNAHS